MSAQEIRLARAFASRTEAGRAALVPYVTAGYPDATSTARLLLGLADAGADVIELGIPFSDPVADGPTIQASSFAALSAGMTLVRALSLLREFRAQRETPAVVFSYLNPVLRYGLESFLAEAVDAGADGLLLTDLPTGADPALEAEIDASGLALIRLIAPTTPGERLREIVRGARGFLYYISRTGVTGARKDLRDELAHEVTAIRELASLPIAVGFGISTPEQAARVGAVADGVVVGSALVRALEAGGVDGAVAFCRSLREGMDGAGEGASAP
jgi:tryptophan synthase alpha chain